MLKQNDAQKLEDINSLKVNKTTVNLSTQQSITVFF